MADLYAVHQLKIAVGRICETIGWQSAKTTTIEQLVNVTQCYLHEITKHMVRCSELNNRCESNLDDLAYAFRAVGIKLEEVRAYTDAVGEIPFPVEVPQFPVPTGSILAPPSVGSVTGAES